MCRAIQTREGPICVYEADDEGDGAGGPAGVVLEVGEDEGGRFMRGRGAGDRNEDCGEGEETEVEGEGCYFGEETAVAVEEEGEGVDEFVGEDDHPGMDCSVGC